jgi:hypothetical protein
MTAAAIRRALRRVLVSPQALALVSLVLLSVALVVFTRFTLPRGLAGPEPLPSSPDGYTEQVAGYVRIPRTGSFALTVLGPGNARLFVDGARAGTFTPADQPVRKVSVAPGVHRVHLQFTRSNAADRPAELAWSDGGLMVPVPAEALAPRSMPPLAWTARDVLSPITFGMVWLWFATGVWAVASPFLGWFGRQLRADEVRPVLGILALCLLLAGHGLSWGLPGGWAQDEIGTGDITAGLHQRFVGGWHHRYPPLHFYLLALVHLPLLAADRFDMIDHWSATSLGEIARITRALTVVMSVGTAALVYLVARTVLSARAAVLGSLCWVLVLTAAFYGKLANLDMPYTFWFAVSLLGYVRALTRNAVRDYVLFAAGAAAAVCTKDQAYGLYLLPVLHLIVHRVRTVAAGATASATAALLRDAALPAAAAAGVLVFAALQALPLNWTGFQQHIAYITGGGSSAYRMIDSSSVRGQAFLFRRTFEHLAWSMSWPGMLMSLAGVALVVVRRRSRTALALLLPALSYYVTFIAVVGYSYDRFMLPVCLVLAIFGGGAIDAAWRPGARRWRTVILAAVLTYMALRTTSINVMMAMDSRYGVERWIGAHVEPNARIGVVEHPALLPRFPDAMRVGLGKPIADLPAVQPEILVITDNYLTRVREDAPERRWYERVLGGAEGYEVVLQHQTKLPFAILSLEPRFRHPDGSFTTLHKVNPLVTVLRRRDRP